MASPPVGSGWHCTCTSRSTPKSRGQGGNERPGRCGTPNTQGLPAAAQAADFVPRTGAGWGQLGLLNDNGSGLGQERGGGGLGRGAGAQRTQNQCVLPVCVRAFQTLTPIRPDG